MSGVHLVVAGQIAFANGLQNNQDASEISKKILMTELYRG